MSAADVSGGATVAAFERHYSIEQLVELWGMSEDFIRGVFRRSRALSCSATRRRGNAYTARYVSPRALQYVCIDA